MKRLIVILYALICGIAAAQSNGLTIPSSHPRLWFTGERLAAARQWHASNPFTPRADDYLGFAFRYLMTGDTAAARTAINYALSVQLDTGGTSSNGARWYGEIVILTYDWCYDQMTPAERTTMVTRWNGYLDALRQKLWGGTDMPQNNYYWGYKRNMLEWAITTWGESSMAQTFLNESLVTRWQNTFLPHASGPGRGGVMQEGTQYGNYLTEYATVPLRTAAALGRNMMDETGFFKETVFYLIYATTPSPTTLAGTSNRFYELFLSNDDANFRNGGTAQRGDVGGFMSMAAELWRDRPVGQWARRWVSMVNPSRAAHIRAVEGSGPAADFSSLPLDYYAAGPQWLFGRTAWGPAATTVHMQLGLLSGVGHSHEDIGNWQMWRGGRWVVREATGYSDTIAGLRGAGSAQVSSSIGHNMIFVNGKGMAQQYNGNAEVRRLETRPQYLYAAANLTPVYRNNLVSYPRADRDNPAVERVEREFVFVRPLETLVIFDRVQANSNVAPAESVLKTFVAHTETAPVPDGANSYVAVNGDQAVRITTLVPAAPTARVIADGGRYGIHRLELETSGTALSYFLNIVQARDANGQNLDARVTETATSYIVALQHPTRGYARVEFVKGATSTGGGFAFAAASAPTATAPFTTGVQAISVSDAGPVWAGSTTTPPPTPTDTTAPTISGVTTSGITTSGATVTWTTSEPADTQVEYGTTTAYGQTTALNGAMTTAHSSILGGLTPGVLYNCRVRSRDAAGNVAVSANYTFTTASATPTQYTITASAGAGGSITPSGTISVAAGGAQSFSIAAQSGYRIADVRVDGNSVGAVGSYAFQNVTSNRTISASFAQNTTTPPPAGSGTVAMTVHAYAAGNGPASLVSNALPLKPGTLTDPRNVRVLDGTTEVPVAAQVLTRWPQDNSIRSLLLQFDAPFTTATKAYTLEIGSPRTTVDAAILPVTWDLPRRIFTLPASYLSESLAMWEQRPHGQTGFPNWETKQIQNYGLIETVGTANCVRDDQYYDSITTTYQMYVRTGELKYLVNARRWALHHRRDQIWLDGSANVGHPRCSGGYLNNTRYTFPQGLSADYMMFGDPEARRVSGLVVDNFYMDPDWDWWWYKAPNTRGFWTEREPAFALTGILSHYEATGDVRYLNFARERIARLSQMQIENGRRAWTHNLYDHDPSEGCATTDYGSSPWMSGALLEGIIRYHKLTGDTVARDSILMAVNDLRTRYLATGSYTGQSFVYLGCSAYRDGVPDLDNLISHAFAYAWRLTGDSSYRTLGSQLLNTSVQNAYTGTHKHFNQQFRSSGHTVAYLGDSGGSTPPPSQDTTAPVVSLTAPSGGQTVSGTITAAATASDDTGVAGVQFYIDGQPYGVEDASAPYSVSINTTAFANGSHTITARARDAAGNVGNSAVVTFTVSNTTADTTAPSVTVTAPTGGQTVSGTITATATASDNVGVSGVQFLIDGQAYGAEDASAPYSVAVNTSSLSNGSHTIVARARDAAGNVRNSASISFAVQNGSTGSSDSIAPTVSMTSPAANYLANGYMTLSATASDNVGVVGVQFYVNGVAVGSEDRTAPYSLSWNSKTLATYEVTSHTVYAVARDAAGNRTQSAPVAFRIRGR